MQQLNVLLQAAASSNPLGGLTSILPFIAIIVIFYFFMMRPQQKKQKAIQEARLAMKVGDKVVTAGGIHGRIREVSENYFTVEIADNVKVRVEKSSVFASPEEIAKN